VPEMKRLSLQTDRFTFVVAGWLANSAVVQKWTFMPSAGFIEMNFLRLKWLLSYWNWILPHSKYCDGFLESRPAWNCTWK